MGINGLLPFVKNACRKGNILELRGKSVAVDVSCLLHRGLTGCMDKIHMGEETQSYVSYVNKYIKELLLLGCHVVMVFDGRPLPAKKGTNDERREQREKRKEHAELLLAKGLEREARDIFRLATSISADIVEKTIEHFRSTSNVDVVVAPYEADAQLAYLMQAKLVDAVITEDSDLIVFGCEKIYFKWQSATGECQVYEKENLKKCFTGELGGDKFDFVKFRRICILAGCDYLQSGLPGVGLSTAAKFFSMTSIKDLRTVLRKVPTYLKNPKLKEHVTEEFITSFERAENTFKHQIVFDPRERCQRPLTDYPSVAEIIDLENDGSEASSSSSTSSTTLFAYAGTACTQRIAIRLALGNPAYGNAIDDRFLLFQPIPVWSVWALRYESKGSIVEKVEKQKEIDATQLGAFKLDSPSVKRVKIPKKIQIEKDDDDIVKQFLEDIEREKTALKKRKNAPEADYSAEKIMKKYSAPEAKKSKILSVDDDFSEFFLDDEVKKSERPQDKKKEKSEKEPVEIDEIEIAEKIEKSKAPAPEIKPPPVRKTISTPTPSTSTPESIKKHPFQSPLLTHQNSAPPVFEGKSESINNPKGEISKYFSKKSSENGTPKVSNPFRCPAFVKPSPPEPKNEENKPSLLSALDDGITDSASSSTSTINNYRFVGFKSAGLSRKPRI